MRIRCCIFNGGAGVGSILKGADEYVLADFDSPIDVDKICDIHFDKVNDALQ